MSTQQTQGIFIRHGQSAANVGLWHGPFAEIPLTETGQQQAAELAQGWEDAPDLIVVSPFLRTRQTATPTMERFPDVPVEYWPIHEFTYWDQQYWKDTTPELSQEEVVRFWEKADPSIRYGSGAESFEDLLGRAESALERLKAVKTGSRVLLFTHGHFIQALRHTLLFPGWTPRQKMQNFRAFDQKWWVKNVELMRVDLHEGAWQMEGEHLMRESQEESAAR